MDPVTSWLFVKNNCIKTCKQNLQSVWYQSYHHYNYVRRLGTPRLHVSFRCGWFTASLTAVYFCLDEVWHLASPLFWLQLSIKRPAVRNWKGLLLFSFTAQTHINMCCPNDRPLWRLIRVSGWRVYYTALNIYNTFYYSLGVTVW